MERKIVHGIKRKTLRRNGSVRGRAGVGGARERKFYSATIRETRENNCELRRCETERGKRSFEQFPSRRPREEEARTTRVATERARDPIKNITHYPTRKRIYDLEERKRERERGRSIQYIAIYCHISAFERLRTKELDIR